MSRLRQWNTIGRPGWSFLIAASLVILTLRIVQLPGGVLPALPVLMITAVPHSFRLLGIRMFAATASSLSASLLAESLAEQPWLLALIACAIAFVAFYLLGRGLDLLSFLIVMAMPVLYAWNAANGADALSTAWVALQVLGIGVIISELTAMVVNPRSTCRSFVLGLATQIRKIPVREGDDSTSAWNARLVSAHTHDLVRIAGEIGDGVRMRNLETAASSVRFLLAFHDDMRLGEMAFGGLDALPGDLASHERAFRAAIAEETEILADAFERDVVPMAGPDLESIRDRLVGKIEATLARRSEDFTEETLAHLANLRHLHQMMVATFRSLRASRGSKPAALPSGLELPKVDARTGVSVYHTLRELLGSPDRTTFQYAMKGTIAMMIAFTIASAYSDWRGAPSLLLLAMLVTTVNVGALTASFMHRSVGLGLAITISIVSIITVGPSLGDLWISTAFNLAVLFPAALLIPNHVTAAAGLNYGMSMMFIFTTFNRLEIDLSLVADRFAAVAGATIIPWLVFLLFRPIYARDRIGENLGLAVTLVAGSWRRLSDPNPLDVENDKSRQIVFAIANASDIADAMRTEAAATSLADATEGMISRIQMLLILSRDLEFRYRFHGADQPDRRELEIIQGTQKILETCGRRIHQPDSGTKASIDADALSGKLAELRHEILASEESSPDPDRLGRLALLESCTGVLRELETRLETYADLLKNRRRIAVGS